MGYRMTEEEYIEKCREAYRARLTERHHTDAVRVFCKRIEARAKDFCGFDDGYGAHRRTWALVNGLRNIVKIAFTDGTQICRLSADDMPKADAMVDKIYGLIHEARGVTT